MNNEIKEKIDDIFWEVKKHPMDSDYLVKKEEMELLLDYITNLQEEVEDLRESDWVWHQLLKTQNKREYRSKFLKEFQEEYGTNTFPDYDEIYKRYDKLKKENKRLKEKCEYLERSNNRREDEIMSLRDECVDGETYKSRNEKAIEKINCLIEVEKKETDYDRFYGDNDYTIKKLNDIKNTLQGKDKDE